ncbi:ribosomal protein S5, C-terminal domain-containing protein [Cokeromyces recurvatus]|uniref:ribosomal protein S5, C-terminal domain-containing protein n=1 Tax=Cokeromyces recurvatus TaxID=90255 RepID=UPI00221E9369|nr:ribosomal protein S5, C-terminal domain-containing protein [Cokeromyces recurvatus]KAI7900262.1 ribosomal protein S5, C-terminal domain-containing protein [Cokeromyces recurvatus]
MLALGKSFSKLVITTNSKSALIPAWNQIRHYATIESNKNSIKKRHEALNKDNVPQLNNLDSILDFPTEKMKTLDQPQLFPSHRPSEVVLNTVTDIIDSPLSGQDQGNLMKKALVIKRVVNMNGKGKQPSMYALVVVGNGNGLAGYGEGKDEEASRAVRKATNRAIKNLRYFERYDNRTISMDLTHKFHATTLELRSRPPGFGIRTNHYVHEICKCIGIQDISAKVRGSKTPMNVIKATFEAFSHQKLPEDIAKIRGKKLSDVQHVYFGGQ